MAIPVRSGSVGASFRFVSFIKSYSTTSATCTGTCIITSQTSLHLGTSRISSAPVFAFGKIKPLKVI